MSLSPRSTMVCWYLCSFWHAESTANHYLHARNAPHSCSSVPLVMELKTKHAKVGKGLLCFVWFVALRRYSVNLDEISTMFNHIRSHQQWPLEPSPLPTNLLHRPNTVMDAADLPCFYRVITIFLPGTSFLGQRWAYFPDFRNFTVHSAYYSVYRAYRALPLSVTCRDTHRPPPHHKNITSMFLGRLLPRRCYYCSVCYCGHVHLTASHRPTIRRYHFACHCVRLCKSLPSTPVSLRLHRRCINDCGRLPLRPTASARAAVCFGAAKTSNSSHWAQ